MFQNEEKLIKLVIASLLKRNKILLYALDLNIKTEDPPINASSEGRREGHFK